MYPPSSLYIKTWINIRVCFGLIVSVMDCLEKTGKILVYLCLGGLDTPLFVCILGALKNEGNGFVCC